MLIFGFDIVSKWIIFLWEVNFLYRYWINSAIPV